MRDAVERLAPSIRTWSATTSAGRRPTGHRPPARGGKGIRPALAMLSAEAAWADAEVGAPGGVAVELVHNFSLIHDDLMDGDLERRHRPTVWAFGARASLCIAGDALVHLGDRGPARMRQPGRGRRRGRPWARPRPR